MKKEDIPILNQILKTLEQIERKLELYYFKKDAEKFNRAKREMLELQRQLSEVLQ